MTKTYLICDDFRDIRERKFMKTKITGEFVLKSATQLHGFDMTEARAAEIARELDRINDAVLAAEADGDFNDEPSQFTRVLAQLKPAKARR